MIKEVTYYDIICDRCGKSLTNEINICFPDTKSAEMVAKNSEWMTIGGKHYCADCYELDEVTDKYIPKKGEICCGEYEVLLYEDTDGFGICGKTKEVCYCGDKCHITHGKP